jgi:hypothetical protein
MKKLIIIAIAGILTCPGLSVAQGKGGDQPATNSTNLNSSKSNIYRQQSPPQNPESSRATTVKGSKSNSDNRTSGQSGQAGIAVSDPGVPNDKPAKTK